ncbi:MAG: hypothetical protein H6650_03230 [Ardenticatenales bacterium]|nr:hypothetical protein [Ardenticatenales bacterium]
MSVGNVANTEQPGYGALRVLSSGKKKPGLRFEEIETKLAQENTGEFDLVEYSFQVVLAT